MTLNLLLFMIISKRTLKQACHDERVQSMMEEVKERQTYYC
ncbi:YrzI family small protein [Ectobacillus sp. JY-23]|nr:YrzI family small protein [Ectobacillus sp. JY-23]UOY92202.1 YrzI family small protein [Ectobacillus sp. JY-23]